MFLSIREMIKNREKMGYVRSLDWLERWDYMDAASQNKASVWCRKKWFGLSFTRSLGSQYTKEGLLRA